MGGKIEGIAALMNYIISPRIGLCIDSCHAFAAGYNIRNTAGIESFFDLIEKEIGLNKLLCFHLNNSKGELGSRLDRYVHISEGLLGLKCFRYIMNNFKLVPKVLETSKENDADLRNLQMLRELRKCEIKAG